MAYQAMARRYRPATFDQVVGQEHVARTLANAIERDRIAHAYLFCGPHGCGKTSMARIFAKALDCTGGPSAELPEDCPICRDISAGSDPDVLEIDGASNNGVEQVRALREQVGYVPSRARFKIYIIDEVHMLSVAAFNALLKTLEEPPPHVKFILATTEPHKLLETVLSRCQRFDFRLVPPPEIAAYLKTLCEREEAQADDDALDAVAAFSGGSMRDALVLLDQLVSYCPDGITRADVERVRGAAGAESVVGVFDCIVSRDLPKALGIVDDVASRGTGAGEFLDQLIEYGRDLMLVIGTKSTDGVSAYGPAREALERHAEQMSLEGALLALDILSTARVRVRSRALSNPLVPVEMAVARLAGLEGVESAGSVLERIESLAKSGALSGGADVCVAPADAVSRSAAPPGEDAGKADAAGPAPSPTADHDDGAQPERSSAAERTPAWDALDPEAADASEPDDPAPPPPPPETLSIDEVRDRWEVFLQDVRDHTPSDFPYVRDTTPDSVEGDVVVLRIDAGGSFLLGKLEEADRRRRLGDSVARVFGEGRGFRVVLSEDEGTKRRSRYELESEAQRDKTVNRLIEHFNGEIVGFD